MYKTQQWLLAIMALCFSTTLLAAINVSVDIKGLGVELEKNVRIFLSIEQQKDHTLLTEGRLHRLNAKATQEITNALQPFGYYRPVIKAELKKTAEGQWQASYNIDPGPALPVGAINFSILGDMNQDAGFQALITDIPLRKGDVFNHLTYDDFKSNLAKLAAERGYFNARFELHRVEIDLDAYQARIDLRYNGGPRFNFGEVALEQEVLDADLLQRFLPFKRGEPYTLNQLIDLQQTLNDSDYFQTVEVSPGKPDTDKVEIPVRVMLTPRKRNRYSLGLGYGTDTGARAKFGWEVPRINSRGHRFNTEAKVSQIGYSLAAHYRVPVLNPRTDQMVYSAGVVNEKTDISESTVQTIGTSLNRSRGQWRESMSVNYQQEEFVLADNQGVSTLLMPGINWSRTWGTYNFIYTLDGLRFDIGLRGASDKLVSDSNFVQLQGGIKTIKSMGSRYRLIARGRVGGTVTDDFHQLPSSVRFFAGGSQSVRGYAYNTLGPVDENNKVIGGKHLMIGSLEFERRLNGNWGIAYFYDAGNAIDNIADKLKRGTGIGLRWKSPIGPVRFDLASAISEDGNPWKLHINIGPDL